MPFFVPAVSVGLRGPVTGTERKRQNTLKGKVNIAFRETKKGLWLEESSVGKVLAARIWVPIPEHI